jgi:hypothetical protein
MTPSRKTLTAFAALAATLTLYAAPASASGISDRKALAQFIADGNKLKAPFTTWSKKSARYEKQSNPTMAGLQRIANPAAKALGKFERELKTQKWPPQVSGDVQGAISSTESVQKDLTSIGSQNFLTVSAWQSQLDQDLTTWQNATNQLGNDLSGNS